MTEKAELTTLHQKNSKGLTSVNICQLDFNSEPSLSAQNIAIEPKFQIRWNPEVPFSVTKNENRIISD
jgi:hypothetical protein